MMKLYRMVKEDCFQDLIGAGVAGHWNKASDSCLYMSDHPDICLESDLVVRDGAFIKKIAKGYGVGIYEVPDDSVRFFTEEELPFTWRLQSELGSRTFGSERLAAAEALVLAFPSWKAGWENGIIKRYDYVINLKHPRVKEIRVLGFDRPLLNEY